MSDWNTYLGRGRRLMESMAWLAAAVAVMLAFATSAALAMWLDRRAGSGEAQTVMIDLPPMPVTEAVADDPGPAPETSADAPDNPDAPDISDEPPVPEQVTEQPPEFDEVEPLEELEEVAEELPDTTPPPPMPEPEPVKKAEVALPKPEKKAAQKPAPKKEAKVADKPAEAKGKKSQASTAAKAGGASASGNNASASEMAKWKSRAQGIVAKHMRRKNYGQRGSVQIVLNVAASGAVTGVSLRGSTGDAGADQAIKAQAQRLQLPAPPGGGTTVVVPIQVKG